YGWGQQAVGLSISVVGLFSIAVGGGLVKLAVDRFGERPVLMLGMGCGIVGFAVYGLAATGTVFWIGVPIQALWGLAFPPMQSLMSHRVGESEQGQLQGALGSLRGIAFMIGPALFTGTFATFIGERKDWHLPGAPFLLASALLVIATGVAWQVTRSRAVPT